MKITGANPISAVHSIERSRCKKNNACVGTCFFKYWSWQLIEFGLKDNFVNAAASFLAYTNTPHEGG